MSDSDTSETRIENAVRIAAEDGMCDGAHNKQWVIDRMVRALLGDKYEAWLADYNADTEYEDWDEGIAP